MELQTSTLRLGAVLRLPDAHCAASSPATGAESDVLVYRDLKANKSYEVGEPVPELGEGLYVVAVASPLHARRAATIVVAHKRRRMDVLERRLRLPE